MKRKREGARVVSLPQRGARHPRSRARAPMSLPVAVVSLGDGGGGEAPLFDPQLLCPDRQPISSRDSPRSPVRGSHLWASVCIFPGTAELLSKKVPSDRSFFFFPLKFILKILPPPPPSGKASHRVFIINCSPCVASCSLNIY